jgi:hypothetical protein
VVRSGPPTPDEKRAAFPEYLADALGGTLPPSDTGLHNDTIAALENLAVGLAAAQPTDVLVAVARAAFDVEMDDRPSD